MREIIKAIGYIGILISLSVLLHNCNNTNKKYFYNFVDLQMTYKNYILINKELHGNDSIEYSFTLLNPVTKDKYKVWVEYYLYHHVYFVGDTIR